MLIPTTLTQRLHEGELLFATFVKTTSHQTVEVLAATGLDALVLDAEHAPFGPESLDRSLRAARATGLPALVRVAQPHGDAIRQALGMGAAGVLVPQVDSAEAAAAVVRAAHGVQDGPGLSTAEGDARIRQHSQASIPQSDAPACVVVQIESMAGVANAAAIAAVPGVDCLFVGPADLAVSLGAQSMGDPRVAEAVAQVCAAGRQAECPVGCFVTDTQQVPGLRALGVAFFVIGSDQALLQRAARQVMAGVREIAVA